MPQYAQVAVEAADYVFDKPYEYLVPQGMTLMPGQRVAVGFGKGNRICSGLVLSLSGETTLTAHKPVLSVLDSEPVLDKSMIKLALWLHHTVFCSVWDALCAMLPTGLRHASEELVKLSDQPHPGTALEGDAAELYTLLKASPEPIARKKLLLPGGRDPSDAVKTLAAQGLLEHSALMKRKLSDKTETLVRLSIPAEAITSNTVRSPKQREVLQALAEHGSLSMSEIKYLTGVTPETVRRLAAAGLAELFEKEVYRRPDIPEGRKEPEALSDSQSAALETLTGLADRQKPACALLHGVTGSGKTNVYLALMAHVLEQGGSCLVLAPEIALTPQLLSKFAARFGERVALLHSGLGAGERMDEWKRVNEGQCNVVVGARSAVFAPLKNLKLIILDEEHESSYKSEGKPRYHAREVAKFRAAQHGALLVLGSATPSLESMYAAAEGKYTYIRLPGRFQNRPLPAVRIEDMAKNLRDGHTGLIGPGLYEEISENLRLGEQTILFLNRRGAAYYVLCPDCHVIPECPYCARRLVYHSQSGRLHCHICGYSEKLKEECPSCGGGIKRVGAGTQRLTEDLKELFPKTRVLRLDADTTARKGSAQEILQEFAQNKAPILVGTQMVAKGLDFPNVTLVGVLNADGALWMPDFRAHEKTFALLTQVVGRGGRGEKPGRAVLQSYSGDGPTLKYACAQDYDAFYNREIELRSLLELPPFWFLWRLCFFGLSQEDVLRAALRMRGRMERWAKERGQSGMRILGPAPSSVPKANMNFRFTLTLLDKNKTALRELCAAVLHDFAADKQNRGVSMYVDPEAEEA